jgi:tetratricopeptide (TPR) repeat protein
MRGWGGRLVLVLVALAIVAGATRLLDRAGEADRDPAGLAALSVSFGPPDYASAEALLDRNVLSARDRVSQAPGEWLGHEILARALYARSRLTGSFEDLAEAARVAARGMDLAPSGSGPVVTSAAIALAVHRPDTADVLTGIADGFVVVAPDGEQAEVEALKGDIAFHNGRYADARDHYERSMAVRPSGGTAYRQGILATRLGAPDAALQHFVNAARLTPDRNAEFVAMLLLQCGAVEIGRGDWDAADRLFALAEQRFAGSWLIRSYRLQLRAARGDLAAARAGYLGILRSAEHPEIMDALALVYRAEGDMPNARLWAARARSIWNRRMAGLPDAAAGHFAEHLLAFGQPGEALAFAERAYRRRPNGDQALLLAAARVAGGDAPGAAEVLQRHQSKGWRTAAHYRQMESAWALAGDGDKAAKARAAALALNPQALAGGTAMIRFGHY